MTDQLKATRKRKTKDPCPVCGLHRELCICCHIPNLRLLTKVTLVVHAKELKRTTNTGRLLIHSLVNSEMRVRGGLDENIDLSDILSPQYKSLLFYPGEDALELNAGLVAQSAKPIQLIVPDGNWRQASKVRSRQKELGEIPCVRISTPNVAQQHLRAESRVNGM